MVKKYAQEDPRYHPFNPNAPRRHSTGMPWPVDPSAIGDDPSKIPHWTGEVQTVHWVAAAGLAAAGYDNPAFGSTTGVTQRAIVQSPLFDLRPDLAGSYRPTATRVPGASRLHFAFYLNDGTFLVDLASTLEVYSVERAALVDPAKTRWMDERQDITTDFYQGTEQSILEWAPAGAPMRFWAVGVVLDWFGGAPPGLTTLGTCH